jgi:arylsulfatase A-like enzyme
LGIRAWLAFGVLDVIVVAAIPWLTQPRHLYAASDWRFAAALLAALSIMGAVCGLAIAALFPKWSSGDVQAASVAGFLAVYALLAANDRAVRPAMVGLVLAVALAGVVLLSLRGIRIAQPYRNPWVVACSLLLTPMVVWDYVARGSAIRTAAALALCLLGIYLLGAAARRISAVRYPLAITAGLSLAVVALNAVAQQLPLRQQVAQGPADKTRPNVVLIVMDTVRADHLSVYGYERDTTPTLKQFGGGAVVYRNGVSAGDMTLSTHASLFTGLYAVRHGAHRDRGGVMGSPLRQSHSTLAEMLAQHGYETAAVVANAAYLSSAFGLSQGFAHYDQRLPVFPLARVQQLYSVRSLVRKALMRFAQPADYDRVVRRAGEINETVFSQLGRLQATGRPFFLFVNYMDAHALYLPPPPFDRKFGAPDARFTREDYYRLAERVRRGAKLSDQRRDQLISQYDGGIAYLDSELARLFDRLKSMGLYENTLIAVTSDHGEAFGEHNVMEHGVSTHSDQVHVPWIVRYPGGAASQVKQSEDASSVDLLPTVLDVAGYDTPAHVEGVSLRKAAATPRPVFAESYPKWQWTDVARFRRVERAVIVGKWKLITSTAGQCELYDVPADPLETKNLCETEEPVARALTALVKKWAGPAGATGPGRPGSGPDRNTLETLKSLGYVQ